MRDATVESPSQDAHHVAPDAESKPEIARRQPDGRSKRWDEHRGLRRDAIVRAGLDAIEEHGTDIGVQQIARSARISRTVLYRYFNDKDDLFQAMALSVSKDVIELITNALENQTQPRQMIFVTVGSVTEWVEEHPMLYQFLRQRVTGNGQNLRYIEESVANNLARMLAAILTWLGAEARFAGLGAQAIVGMVENSVSWWVNDPSMAREEVTLMLSDFIWDAVAGYLTKIGISLDPDAAIPTEVKSGT